MESQEQNLEELTTGVEGSKSYDLAIAGELIALIRDETEETVKLHIANHIKKIISKHELDHYHTVILYDDYFHISKYHSNKIYEALQSNNVTKDILMIIVSDGGKIEPAYLISKTCKRLARSKFAVSIPRRAKSAATLIALGADEIHMGFLSELGPIDPQFSGFPASGLANAVEKIAALSSKFPDSSEMFAKYLTANLNIRDLGYFERINESASQYAHRLLDGKIFPENRTSESLADHFTNHYKDHSFVIDADEASRLLGKTIVRESTIEYELGNDLYMFFEFADFVFGFFQNKTMRYVGSIEQGMDLNDKKLDKVRL